MQGIDSSAFVYYDTGIWVSYIVGPSDRYFADCKPLIDDVRRGDRIAVVSHPLIMETQYALRKKYARAPAFDMPEPGYARQATQPAVDRFAAVMKSLMEGNMATLPSYGMGVGDYHEEMAGWYGGYCGRFRQISVCRGCGSHFPWAGRGGACMSCGAAYEPSVRHRYGMLSPADMEHAYLARHGLASEFYTNDAAFDDLNGDPRFFPMRFNVVRRGAGGGPAAGAAPEGADPAAGGA